MNNTDKLLRAFIEASGFDIEELVDTMAFRSEENYPVYIILKYLPK